MNKKKDLKRFRTHGECKSFKNGICILIGKAVNPDDSICPNFEPKNE